MITKQHKKTELRKNLLKELYYGGALSLTELSVLTHKSLPLITSTVSELLEDGFVVEHGLAPSTGGRRPVTFLLNKEKQRYIAAVSMDQIITRMVIYDLQNNDSTSVESVMFDLHAPHAEEKLLKFLENYLSRSGIAKTDLLGIGICMPGFINVEEGINYSFLNNSKEGIRDYLQQRVQVPVFIDNDSSAIAMAELKFGAAKGLRDVMVVNVGWGIGLGMIVNGGLFRGHSGLAGEFSHIPLSKTDNLCSCGKRGCLEVEASLLVIAEKAKEAIARGEQSSLEVLFQQENIHPGDQLLLAAKSGDPLAISMLSESAFMIGKGIATLIHIMNPEQIVLSGRGAIAGKILLAPIHQAINEFCIPRLAENTGISVSSLAYRASLLGAATLVIENCEFE